jgi:hypothetical protein
MELVRHRADGLSKVEIETTRWKVYIHVYEYGEKFTYVASADSAHTEGSGIWFGTEDELAAINDRF